MAQVPNDLNIKFHYNDRLGLKAIVPKAPQSHIGSVYQNSFAVKGPRRGFGTCYPKTLHLLIILTPSRPVLADSCCHLETLPLSLVMRHRSLKGKRDIRMLPGGQLQSTMVDGLVDPSHYLFKGIQRYTICSNLCTETNC